MWKCAWMSNKGKVTKNLVRQVKLTTIVNRFKCLSGENYYWFALARLIDCLIFQTVAANNPLTTSGIITIHYAFLNCFLARRVLPVWFSSSISRFRCSWERVESFWLLKSPNVCLLVIWLTDCLKCLLKSVTTNLIWVPKKKQCLPCRCLKWLSD